PHPSGPCRRVLAGQPMPAGESAAVRQEKPVSFPPLRRLLEQLAVCPLAVQRPPHAPVVESDGGAARARCAAPQNGSSPPSRSCSRRRAACQRRLTVLSETSSTLAASAAVSS